ncbi:nitrate/nitrite transporter [Microbacterium suaedae]|uniref:nitrate/nitrite transporter n=1 Tax=Microbacterium suaedae TaxID=2067813 RepID=UPI000DA12B37|nr:MFS transporter [Microbacterium suaedae]
MSSRAPDRAVEPTGGQRTLALVMATLGFAVNFWAWSLLSPLGPVFVEQGLAEDAAFLVAVPVLIGSIGRILVGALTDRFGGRLMMPTISLLTIVPLLFIGFIGQHSFVTLVIGGFFLGVAGTSFAVGVPYVNSWFPPKSRGTAIGVYGVGMGGTAIAAFTTVPLFEQGDLLPFVITAVALAVYAILALLLMKNAPGWEPQKKDIGHQLLQTASVSLTWQACYLYALSFGGYVAFSVYIPTYLVNAYGLDGADASLRMAGFVIAAVVMRPIGGFLSDKMGAARALVSSSGLVLVAAIVLAFDPPLMPLGTACFLLMAVGLGAGSGATFALIAQTSEPSMVGSITGFVGAAGGLGGFVPPLLLGWMWTELESYTLGIVFLAVCTAIALVIALYVGRARATAPTKGA